MFCYSHAKKKIAKRKNLPESEVGSGPEVLEIPFRDRWLTGRCILGPWQPTNEIIL